MTVGSCRIELRIPESDSLKAKRRVLKSLKDRVQARFNVGIAEEEGHHPDLHISWGKCRLEIWTHKIDGLTESDFFLAAKADRAREAMETQA